MENILVMALGCHHVEVEDGGNGGVEHRALRHGSARGPEGYHEESDGDSYAVV